MCIKLAFVVGSVCMHDSSISYIDEMYLLSKIMHVACGIYLAL